MTHREKQGWIIVASLFVTLSLVFGGGYTTGGIFVSPLIKHFGWSRTKVSTLQGLLAISAGVSAPFVGWLLDRVEARAVMGTGAVIAAAAYLLASIANSYPVILAAYLIMGIGLACATLLPCAMLIANWFETRRGVAMALAFCGTSFGGMLMTLLGTYAILHFGGWRAGYRTLAAPMLLIATPLLILTVRTRPPGATPAASVATSGGALPGLEVRDSVRTRSFWLLCVMQLVIGTVGASVALHLIAFLIDRGYTAQAAASIFSLLLVCGAVGKLLMGALADRIGARITLALNYAFMGVAMVLLPRAGSGGFLAGFVIFYGLAFGGALVLIPIVQVDSLGLKRFGSVAGLAGFFQTVGASVGPIVTGRIFDLMGSYTLAFQVFLLLAVIGAAATLMCLPLETEQARLVPVHTTAA
jgi:MFS family permease